MEKQGLPSLESAIENLDSLLEEMAKAPYHLWAQRVLEATNYVLGPK